MSNPAVAPAHLGQAAPVPAARRYRSDHYRGSFPGCGSYDFQAGQHAAGKAQNQQHRSARRAGRSQGCMARTGRRTDEDDRAEIPRDKRQEYRARAAKQGHARAPEEARANRAHAAAACARVPHPQCVLSSDPTFRARTVEIRHRDRSTFRRRQPRPRSCRCRLDGHLRCPSATRPVQNSVQAAIVSVSLGDGSMAKTAATAATDKSTG